MAFDRYPVPEVPYCLGPRGTFELNPILALVGALGIKELII